MTHARVRGAGLRYDRSVLGQRQSWSVVHRGLEYPGEIVVVEAVDPDLGLPLANDLSFRVVFYTVPRRIPVAQLRDPRIAIAVPRRSADPASESLSREVDSIRETSVRYMAGTDSESSALRTTMAERADSLMAELARRQTLNYSQGRIYTQAGVTVRPADRFDANGMDTWVQRIVERVLADTFPTLPFEWADFPSTLTADKIDAVFRGLFQGDPAAAETAAAFAPALGLSSPDAPTVFDGGDCSALGAIEDALASEGGEMDAQSLIGLLCRGHGLNRDLAYLYVLAFVRRSHAGVGVSGNSLRSPLDETLPGEWVTSDILADLHFPTFLADHLGAVRARPPLTWNLALPYATLMADGLEAAEGEAEIATQEGRLLSALGEMGGRMEQSRQDIEALAHVLDGDADVERADLDKLQVLCTSTGYLGFYAVAVESFASPSGLRRALDMRERLDRLSSVVLSITEALTYLTEMTTGKEHPELAIRKDSVMGRIGMDSLLADPSLWGSVEDSFRQLRGDYASAYVSHHARYHDESVELLAMLERLGPQVEALASFNGVPELGGPFHADVPERYRSIQPSLLTCALSGDEVSLDEAPVCGSCQLRLTTDIPRREAGSLVRDIEHGMREYNRRLGSKGVRMILSHPNKEQLEKLLDLARVSDLSTLANVLDAEVVEFLRGFVRED